MMAGLNVIYRDIKFVIEPVLRTLYSYYLSVGLGAEEVP